MPKLVKTPRQKLGEIININIGIKNAQFGVRTEKDFERKTGIKSSTYNTHKHNPMLWTVEQLQRVADAYRCNPAWFLMDHTGEI